jgi:hypothetical protein
MPNDGPDASDGDLDFANTMHDVFAGSEGRKQVAFAKVLSVLVTENHDAYEIFKRHHDDYLFGLTLPSKGSDRKISKAKNKPLVAKLEDANDVDEVEVVSHVSAAKVAAKASRPARSRDKRRKRVQETPEESGMLLSDSIPEPSSDRRMHYLMTFFLACCTAAFSFSIRW